MEHLEMQGHATAVFPDRHAVRVVIDQLAQAGFSRDDISVVMSEATHDVDSPDSGTTAVLRAIVAGLLHVASGLVAAGPLAMAFAEQRFPDEMTRQLEQGGILVGVRSVDSRAELAARILELSGGAVPHAA
jgi:hypothetical protein